MDATSFSSYDEPRNVPNLSLNLDFLETTEMIHVQETESSQESENGLEASATETVSVAMTTSQIAFKHLQSELARTQEENRRLREVIAFHSDLNEELNEQLGQKVAALYKVAEECEASQRAAAFSEQQYRRMATEKAQALKRTLNAEAIARQYQYEMKYYNKLYGLNVSSTVSTTQAPSYMLNPSQYLRPIPTQLVYDHPLTPSLVALEAEKGAKERE